MRSLPCTTCLNSSRISGGRGLEGVRGALVVEVVGLGLDGLEVVSVDKWLIGKSVFEVLTVVRGIREGGAMFDGSARAGGSLEGSGCTMAGQYEVE